MASDGPQNSRQAAFQARVAAYREDNPPPPGKVETDEEKVEKEFREILFGLRMLLAVLVGAIPVIIGRYLWEYHWDQPVDSFWGLVFAFSNWKSFAVVLAVALSVLFRFDTTLRGIAALTFVGVHIFQHRFEDQVLAVFPVIHVSINEIVALFRALVGI